MSFQRNITIDTGGKNSGFFLVSANLGNGNYQFGPPTTPKIEEVTPITTSPVDYTVGILGGQKLFLLSQDSTSTNKTKIDLKSTLYGIPEPKIKDLEERTFSSVRGENLVEVLESIVRFIQNHSHPEAPSRPIPIAGDVIIDSITAKIKLPNFILNKNIRIN